MPVKMRLNRGGAKRKPYYQLVVADERAPRDGRCIAYLGQYDPKQNPPTLELKDDKIMEWLQQGAQPSDTVVQLLRKKGLWQKFQQQRHG